MTEEHQPKPEEDREEFAEESGSLWRITLGPTAWALHFVVCYTLVAMSCAKGWPVDIVRAGLGVLTVAVLGLILRIGHAAWRRWNVSETGDYVNRRGMAEDRHHFLGHAAFLLAVISFIGVVFVSLPLLLLEGCR